MKSKNILTSLLLMAVAQTTLVQKFILTFVLLCASIASANAQLLRSEELEKYAKERYGEKWVDAATNLSTELELDKNNALTYTQIIECPGKTKDQLYVLLNYWVSATFNDANSVIKLNDKENGVIICQGCMSDIAAHQSLFKLFRVSINPVIKIDIKEGKIRVTYTIQGYDLDITISSGSTSVPPTRQHEKWTLDECFPFAEKDSHKKTSCKALIMTHAYSNVVMDKIEEAVKNGLVGNEDDDW